MSAANPLKLEVPTDFGCTEEHALLRAEARRFLSERLPMAELRKLARNQLKLPRRQLHAIDVIAFARPAVGHKNLGRALLNYSVGDSRAQRIARALGRKHHARVLFAQRLEPFAQLRGEGRTV